MVHFMTGEAQQMTSALSVIRSSLSALLRTLSPHSHGDPHTLTNSPHLTLLTISLLSHKVPYLWVEAVGPTGPPQSWPLEAWVSDLMLRWAFLDQVLSVGVAKVPAYWLGAFFNPQGFLSILTQVGKELMCFLQISISPYNTHTTHTLTLTHSACARRQVQG